MSKSPKPTTYPLGRHESARAQRLRIYLALEQCYPTDPVGHPGRLGRADRQLLNRILDHIDQTDARAIHTLAELLYLVPRDPAVNQIHHLAITL